jgi:type II secretory pathway component GspD/PulD (secretin)
LILIATKTDIKRVLRIVAALDSSLATSSSIKVVTLLYANAKDAADLVAKLFAPETSSQTSRGNMPDFSGGPPDAGFAGAPTPTGRTSTENNAATRHNAVVSKVVAVADERSNSVILNCPPDLFARIEKMLRSLDQPMIESTELRVFRLANADPAELAEQIAQLYSEQTTSKGDANDMPTMFPPGPMGSRGNVNAAGTDSDRPKKAGKVMAVADPRSSALVVSASKTVMPQIAKMIESLDSDSGKREIVSYFELRNADPQDIYQNLQELFNRSTAQMGNNNQNNFLGRNNPLTQRQMQSQQSSTSTTAAMGSGASSPGATGAASNRSAP